MTLTPTASILETVEFAKLQHDVDVVNHHVQHHAHVDAAERHRADAGDFHEPRLDFEPGHRPDRRIEPLDMSHLHRYVLPLGRIDDLPGLGNVLGQGLFDQAGDLPLDALLGDAQMKLGWYGDGDGIDLSQQVFNTFGHGDRKLVCHGSRHVIRGVEHAHQLDAGHLGIDSHVQPAHPAATDDSHAQPFFRFPV